jgi:ATP-binding cassette subfamily B protein
MKATTPQKPAPKGAGHQTVFGMYSREILKRPWLFSALVAGTLLTQVADLVSPLYMKQFFNTLTLSHANPTVVHGLIVTLVIIGVLAIADWVFTRLQIFSIMYLESSVMASLYSSAFDYLIAHSYQFFTSQFTGTLTRRISKFSAAFESLLDSIMLQFAPTAIFVTGAVIILFIRNHTLGLLLGGWAVAFVIFQIWVAKLRQPLRVASSAEDSRMTGALADALSNQTTISLFAGSTFEHARFIGAIKKWKAATMRSWNADEYIWAALGLFIVFINIAMLYGAIIFWQRGLLTIGDFVLIQAYLLTTFQQLIGINRNLRRFYDSYADSTEMIDILNTPHEIKDLPDAKKLVVSEGVIDFKDIEFYFHANRLILENFNLHIKGNEKVALVGPSGAGKSTITKLLLRFYDVRGGEVLIDGQNISDVTQDSLRESVAFVPQEPVLFHRTLMENIRYGRRDATDEEVLEAAKKAHCHEFISGFPDKYETFVGERGVRLSGGERQRVAIARAMLKNAPILVLDEATSSLDSESEALIQSALDVLMEGKTVITIAHRLSTIMKMDRIVVIDGGKVVAEGTHDKLLEDESGLYHKLWSIQAGGFIADEDELSEGEEAEAS